MKNLANCKPSEFLVQTNRIRKSVEKWLNVTKILEIRKAQPKLADGLTKDELKAALEAQAKKNLSDILDAILDEHPQETLELIALMCFIEPKDVDNYPTSEYLKAVSELISDEAVIGFFTSLVQLGQTGILNA